MTRSRAARRLTLPAIATAVLAGATGCGCHDVPDEISTYNFEETITESHRLEQIRNEAQTDDERCTAACFLIANRDLDEVVQCQAVGNNVEDPWNEDNDEVEITCTGEISGPGFCTGRRPQGHHEAELAVVSKGTWFAVHAHLERASVTAFTELAAWLEQHGAPTSLIERCTSAAADEVVHGELMTKLARAHAGTVPDCVSEPASDAIFDVAVHNAVEGCVHEAFAAIVAQYQATVAPEEDLRAVFQSIASDELRHGQLAWDLHDWLLSKLSEPQRIRVMNARRRALTELPERVARDARATPPDLGWPDSTRARAMAEHFATLLDANTMAAA
jgi:hypothetical protein